MKISLATNFDNGLIDQIKGYEVYEIYGRLTEDYLSGGRPTNAIQPILKEQFESHVKKVREAGINFNYLLNGACTENLEQDKTWRQNFKDFILYLKSVGVNAFTITNPLILILVKKIYPESICRVSTFSCVNTLEKAKYWESMGADIICADFVSINRNFTLLKTMCEELKTAKIEILVTNSCIKDCPYIHTHTNSISHASLKNGTGGYVDWCLFKCQNKELLNPYEYIKSPWVRPEDIAEYERIGIEHFKITERDFPTEILLKRLKAYTNRTYDGNLLDLIQGHGYMLASTTPEKFVKNENLETKEDVIREIYRVRGFKQERKVESHCFIDNKKLDGFLKFFTDGNCSGNCSKCGYCKNIAKNAITVNDEISQHLISCYEKLESFMTEVE